MGPSGSFRVKLQFQQTEFIDLHSAIVNCDRFIMACARCGELWVSLNSRIPKIHFHCKTRWPPNRRDVTAFPVAGLIKRGSNSKEPNLFEYQGVKFRVCQIKDMREAFAKKRLKQIELDKVRELKLLSKYGQLASV
jgi:hypothetical protein